MIHRTTIRRLPLSLAAAAGLSLGTSAMAAQPLQAEPVQTAPAPEVAAPAVAPEVISDWALAGVVWSDASLTKKLAIDALRKQPEQVDAEALRRLIAQSTQVIEALEQFGWKQTPRPTQVAENGPATPNPALARNVAADAQVVRRPAVDPPPRALTVGDPHATSGRTAPGAVEDKVATGPEREIEPFGVEDYVDETPGESVDPVDAAEDGVEAAIAAAPASDVPGPEVGAGRISQREMQTRSTTLPYSVDSIYDADDYDPDVDYQVDNPLAPRSADPRTNDLLDDDQQVAAQSTTDSAVDDEPAVALDPEVGVVRPGTYANPLVRRTPATLPQSERPAPAVPQTSDAPIDEGEQESAALPATPGVQSPAVRPTAVQRYTTADPASHKQDAAWVQLRLDENQLHYASLGQQDNLNASVATALNRLRTSALMAGRTTDDQALKDVLAPILQMKYRK
ncbi:hypothetical protein [Roseimaritima sediminicola]|uniref:hypothetical protein n=1 Tax=Roseimaritima sediminicola TaxID=2662066 RepID=UPI00129838D9|nr:hypothetical protein [Roseimaritima sediminicola]